MGGRFRVGKNDVRDSQFVEASAQSALLFLLFHGRRAIFETRGIRKKQ
jgi:hypothetical protein